jgi:hypothetical protein
LLLSEPGWQFQALGRTTTEVDSTANSQQFSVSSTQTPQLGFDVRFTLLKHPVAAG